MVGRTVDLGAAAGNTGDNARRALAKLDAITQLSVESATTTAQPGSPTVDQAYIIPASATGAVWATFTAGRVAVYRGTSFTALSATGYWEQLTPNEGWSAWVRDTDKRVVYSGSAWADAAEETLADQRDYGQLQGFKNRLINGGFLFNQRAAASNADDTYGPDRWYLLTQSNAVANSGLTDPENGAPRGIRITQSNATPQRMGIAQIIESVNCRDLRATVATLAGRVRLSSSADVRYAVLEWTGTADVVTSDIVADWTSSGYTQGGGFFNTTTLNVLACGEVACTAATWRTLTGLNATIGSSANNIIVFVWTESTVAQNVTLDLNRMQFEPGSVATPFEHRPTSVEQALCYRYYLVSNYGSLGSWVSATQCVINGNWPATMRTAPTVSLATTTPVVTELGVATRTGTASTLYGAPSVSVNGFVNAAVDGFTGATAAKFAATASNFLIADAEL